MNRQNVTNWCRDFSEGRTAVHDEQRSGRPSLISDDLLQETEGEIRANRRVTIGDLHYIIPEVSKTTILDRRIRVQKIVRMLGAQNINGRSQNETVPR
jgi:transposase